MADKWREMPLSELCSYINRGSAPKYVESGGVLVLNQKCIRDQQVNFVEARRTDHKKKPIDLERRLQPFDILVNSTGVGTLGRVAQLHVVPELVTVDSHVTIVRPDPKMINPNYLGFVVRLFEHEIEALGEGSTGQTELSRKRLADFIVPVAPDTEQRAIAHILGTLDDKIELNRKMNETLEAMARALFKSWFVDFDPVRAKADVGARRAVPLPKHIADLFPDSFEDSEMGEIPKGWTPLPLYSTATFINGAAYKSEDFCNLDEGIPVIKIAELKEGISAQTRYSQRIMDISHRIDTGDLLYSWSGSPDTSLDTFLWASGPGLLNQHIFKVVVPDKSQKRIVYYLLKYLRPVLVEIARNKQTTGLGHVTVADLKRLLVCWPSSSILSAFDWQVAPIFDRAFDNILESRTLTTLRDTLLPKLISGELSIKDAERFADGWVK
jgi:type I restriction enzyme S subunit